MADLATANIKLSANSATASWFALGVMQTAIDRVKEFAVLDDAKTRGWGRLPPADERRWAELRSFDRVFEHAELLPERKIFGGESRAADNERSEKKSKRCDQSHG